MNSLSFKILVLYLVAFLLVSCDHNTKTEPPNNSGADSKISCAEQQKNSVKQKIGSSAMQNIDTFFDEISKIKYEDLNGIKSCID